MKSYAKDDFDNAVIQPAKVVVVEKTGSGRICPYVNLFPPPDGQAADALFTMTAHVREREAENGGARFFVAHDQSRWSWQSSSLSEDHEEVVLVTLTDADHVIVAKSGGYENAGPTDRPMLVIGDEERRMSEDGFVLCDVVSVAGEL